MALNTKRFLKLDPIVWLTFPPSPGFKGMPAHQAKEGALLLLEAGAPAHPGLVRMASSFPHAPFRMEDAIELSQARIEAREKARQDAARKERVARGELVVIEPVAKMSEADQQRALAAEARKARLTLSQFPVRVRDSVGARILAIMAARKEPVQFSTAFCQEMGLWRGSTSTVGKIVRAAAALAEQGLVTRLTRGSRAEPSKWALTELGRANAAALKGGSDAETA